VHGDGARDTARALAQSEGIFAGFSSGANVEAALQLLAGEMAGMTVAVLICDSGLKYLSTGLWA
jgi:cysteine synthase A